MGYSLKKACFVLTVIFAITQVIRIILSNRLESVKASRRHDYSSFVEVKSQFLNQIKESSVLDSSGQYQIVPFLLRASNLGSSNLIKRDVGLVTQTSPNHLSFLSDISQRWQGLVSVAVFSDGSSLEATVNQIISLLLCHPEIRFNTSIHLIFPFEKWDGSRISKDGGMQCNSLHKPEEHISYEMAKVAYPVNLLRNVARRQSTTEFIFVIDIDLVPSSNFRSEFMTFAEQNHLFDESKLGENTVYVVPTYEMSEDQMEFGIPSDKKSLIECISRSEIRPFYIELCWKCHKYTDYDLWEKAPASESIEVIYEVSWKDPWEPFYIGRSNVPYYDERFKQYGFNRISQACELHVAGYKFLVLNNLFLIHRGLKQVDSFHAAKEEDQERNRILFRHFKHDLQEKYSSGRKCY